MPESRASLGWADLAFAFLAAVTLFIAPAARAQRNTRARPVYQRPIISQPSMRSIAPLPMPLRPALSPVATAVQRPILNPLPRALPSRISPAPQLAMPRSYAPYTFAEPALSPGVFEPNFRPTAAWRGIGAFGSPYHLGGWFAPDYGYWQVPSSYQMLPLGFGLWPACDSASIPGRFWTLGPCSGIGDYLSLAATYPNQYLMGSEAGPYYQAPIVIVAQPQSPQSGATQSSAPEQKANMVICLIDGRQIEVADWWVTEGRFFFVAVNGKQQSVDLDKLDLKKTIETDEQRGRTFMLNFTPPDQRP